MFNVFIYLYKFIKINSRKPHSIITTHSNSKNAPKTTTLTKRHILILRMRRTPQVRMYILVALKPIFFTRWTRII